MVFMQMKLKQALKTFRENYSSWKGMTSVHPTTFSSTSIESRGLVKRTIDRVLRPDMVLSGTVDDPKALENAINWINDVLKRNNNALDVAADKTTHLTRISDTETLSGLTILKSDMSSTLHTKDGMPICDLFKKFCTQMKNVRPPIPAKFVRFYEACLIILKSIIESGE